MKNTKGLKKNVGEVLTLWPSSASHVSLLPGQVLFLDFAGNVWIYTPDASILAAGVVKSIEPLSLSTLTSHGRSRSSKKQQKRTTLSNGQASRSKASRTPSGAQSKTRGLGKK